MTFFKTVLIALVICMSFTNPSVKAWADPIPVFVSIVPQKYFVERIGGDQVKVEVMVKSGESPATFNPNPKKMSLLSQAKLYFSIGVPFESIWIKRIQSIYPNLKITPLHDASQRKSELNHGHAHSSHHSHETGDPHIWTSPKKVKMMAKKIMTTLTQISPVHEKYFEQNFQNFIEDLNTLDSDIKTILAKGGKHRFMVFHPAWSYFAEDYNLEQIPIEEEGKEPGARALQGIIEKGKKLGIKVIFVQKQFSLSVARKIAKMIGATVKEMDPLAEDYLANMRRTAKAISGDMQ